MRGRGNANMSQIQTNTQQSIQGNQTISQKITDYLNDNNRLISQAYIAQCHENYDQAQDNLEKLVSRMINMMENADRNNKLRQVIQENREILSEAQIKQYHELNRASMNKSVDQNYYLDYYINSLPLKKQIEKKKEKKKIFWTEYEKTKFKEALQKFGKKDLKKISEYIGTKIPIQVRSHMQKYFMRLEKEGKQTQEGSGSSEKKGQNSEKKKKYIEEIVIEEDNQQNKTQQVINKSDAKQHNQQHRYQQNNQKQDYIKEYKALHKINLIQCQIQSDLNQQIS